MMSRLNWEVMAAEMPIIIIIDANNLGNLTHTVAWLNCCSVNYLAGWIGVMILALYLCIVATILKYSLWTFVDWSRYKQNVSSRREDIWGCSFEIYYTNIGNFKRYIFLFLFLMQYYTVALALLSAQYTQYIIYVHIMWTCNLVTRCVFYS